MPRKLLRRLLPAPHHVRADRSLRHFGGMLANRGLWQLNRRSVARAGAVGLFVAFLPIPGQTLIAAAAAIWLGINLPVAVVMVWVTNPLTFPFFAYAAYRIGTWLLDTPHRELRFEMSSQWLMSVAGIWEPLAVGCLVLGILASGLGYLLIRLAWRLHVVWAWHGRRERKAEPEG